MKKVIFIFLILISCLCLAVVSCAVKEESSEAALQLLSTASIVDGSAEGYMKIGNMLMVWGDTSSSANFPISFAATPTVTATVKGSKGGGSSDAVTIESVTTSSVTLGLSSGITASYIAVGKWQ